MPNAAAHFDDDFGIEQPARKKAPRRASGTKAAPGKRKKKGKSRFSFAFNMHSVSRYAAIGMSGTVVVGILVNALIMQKGHHPAPLFGKSIALGQNAAPPHPAAPVPAPKKADTAAATPAPAAEPAKRTAERDEDAASGSEDAIGRLLQGGASKSGASKGGAQNGSVPAERPNSKTVLAVQRALTKVGITVKQTGTFGPQTRKAIEHFEKDHHLPVKGDLNRRMVKLLASESHTKIEQ